MAETEGALSPSSASRPPPQRGSLKAASRVSIDGLAGLACQGDDSGGSSPERKRSSVRFSNLAEEQEFHVASPPSSPSNASSAGSSPDCPSPEEQLRSCSTYGGSPRRLPAPQAGAEDGGSDDDGDASSDEDQVVEGAQATTSFRVLRSLQALNRALDPRIERVETAVQALGRARAHRTWARSGIVVGFTAGREAASRLQEELSVKLERLGLAAGDEHDAAKSIATDADPEAAATANDQCCRELAARAARAEALLKAESAEMELQAVRAELDLRALRAEQELAAMRMAAA